MRPMQFKGFIEKIFPATEYSQEIVVANFKDEKHKANLMKKGYAVNQITFRASTYNNANDIIAKFKAGDEVLVHFYISGKAGISKKGTYYHFNELRIANRDGIVRISGGEDALPESANAMPESDADIDDGSIF